MSAEAPKVYQFGHATEATEQARRQSLVSDMCRMLQGGEQLKCFAASFAIALRDRVWERTRRLDSGRTIEPISFRCFVSDPYPVGIGSNEKQVRALIASSELPDREALEAQVRAAWGAEVKGHGGERDNAGRPAVVGPGSACDEDIQAGIASLKTDASITPNTADYTRARLARDADPDRTRLDDDARARAAALLADVDGGKVSCNAAAVEMGYRKRKSPLDTMKAAWAKASPEERAAFLTWVDRPVFDNTRSA
ncbi:hypothetical protein [Pararhodospirillum photometricum]|uniref:hypothetical protein n=1 Tax=Pararhodospirillum photometricum TaxID=1084 RepID=UPI0005A269FF|nr:hypothetical protein [Pararhodospirillum photometricum]